MVIQWNVGFRKIALEDWLENPDLHERIYSLRNFLTSFSENAACHHGWTANEQRKIPGNVIQDKTNWATFFILFLSMIENRFKENREGTKLFHPLVQASYVWRFADVRSSRTKVCVKTISTFQRETALDRVTCETLEILDLSTLNYTTLRPISSSK